MSRPPAAAAGTKAWCRPDGSGFPAAGSAKRCPATRTHAGLRTPGLGGLSTSRASPSWVWLLAPPCCKGQHPCPSPGWLPLSLPSPPLPSRELLSEGGAVWQGGHPLSLSPVVTQGRAGVGPATGVDPGKGGGAVTLPFDPPPLLLSVGAEGLILPEPGCSDSFPSPKPRAQS